MAGPWEKYQAQAPQQPVMISPPDPKLPGELAGQGLSNVKTRQDIGQGAIAAAKQQFELEGLRKERALQARKYNEAKQGAAGDLAATIRNIDALRKDVTDTPAPFSQGLGETGFLGRVLRNVPGSAAYDLGQDVTTIQASTAFDRLQKMRDMSPTGGALGAIAVPELEMLKNSLGSLDPNQSQENVLKNAKQVRQRYLDMLRRVDPAAARRLTPKSAKQAPSVSRIKSDEDYDRLPSGATFIAPDGSRRRKP